MLFILTLVLAVVSFALTMIGIMPGADRAGQMLAAISLPLSLGASLCAIVAMFKIRSSLLQYYNTVEPIQLRLSPVMTFFFSVFYFQHHFTRIATWKKTGHLTPQKG